MTTRRLLGVIPELRTAAIGILQNLNVRFEDRWTWTWEDDRGVGSYSRRASS